MPTASTRIAKHPRRLVFSLLCNLYRLPEEHRAHPRMSVLPTVCVQAPDPALRAPI